METTDVVPKSMEEFEEIVEEEFFKNFKKCKKKSLSMLTFNNNEDLSKSWIIFKTDEMVIFSFEYDSEKCTVKNLLELIGMEVSEDVTTAKIVGLPGMKNFKICIQDINSNCSKERLLCMCHQPQNESTENDTEDPRTIVNDLPYSVLSGYFVTCLNCHQETLNHESCDNCLFVFNKQMNCIPFPNNNHIDETENPTTTTRTYTVHEIVRDFNSYELQIYLEQIPPVKKPQYFFSIDGTKEGRVRIPKQLYDLKLSICGIDDNMFAHLLGQ